MTNQTIPPECDQAGITPISYEVQNTHILRSGSHAGFLSSGSPEAISIGDEFVVRLRNTTDDVAETGTRWMYAVERQADSDWTNISSTKGSLGFDAKAVRHAPGEGFEWEFTMTPFGLSDGPYYVCSELEPGRYRFVYFGLGFLEGQDDPPGRAVATEFELQS